MLTSSGNTSHKLSTKTVTNSVSLKGSKSTSTKLSSAEGKGILLRWAEYIGQIGGSAYEIALKKGFDGTEEEWLESLKGSSGKSVYDIAVENGFNGTEAEWLESLKSVEIDLSDYVTKSMLADESIELKEYADDSVFHAVHRMDPVRRLVTHQRNFTSASWNNYGAVGHIENWSNTQNYADFKIGDLGVIYGTNTDTKQYVALVGKVVVVQSGLRMNTLACYQTDEYKEVTEYGMDLIDSITALTKRVETLEDELDRVTNGSY